MCSRENKLTHRVIIGHRLKINQDLILLDSQPGTSSANVLCRTENIGSIELKLRQILKKTKKD